MGCTLPGLEFTEVTALLLLGTVIWILAGSVSAFRPSSRVHPEDLAFYMVPFIPVIIPAAVFSRRQFQSHVSRL